jgi:hypothetical protein
LPREIFGCATATLWSSRQTFARTDTYDPRFDYPRDGHQMSGSLRLDAKFPTIEQEAPLVPRPMRAVEIFSQNGLVYLRIGPVEGVDPAHGSYTLMLNAQQSAEIADALQDVRSDVGKARG